MAEDRARLHRHRAKGDTGEQTETRVCVKKTGAEELDRIVPKREGKRKQQTTGQKDVLEKQGEKGKFHDQLSSRPCSW